MKVHFHKGTHINGATLCGRLVEFPYIEGNVGGYKNDFCKACRKIRRAQIRKKKSSTPR